nr:transposase, mutator type [Tanacetum cinerariifolium]
MQTTEGKVDTSTALDSSLVGTESSGTKSKEQDTSSRSGNDTHTDDADTRPIYNEEPMAEEKGFAIAALKNDLIKLQGNSVDTKFAKPSILGKPILHPLRNQSVVRQPTAFKSERAKSSKPCDDGNPSNVIIKQHYGIRPAITELFPAAQHVYCLRRIHDNMKLKWGGSTYKGLLWKSAIALKVPQFQEAMEQLKTFNKHCYDWQAKIPPMHRARSHFLGFTPYTI